ncbi:hypothetical protein [Desulfocapsa sulfexigens]|uniref:hypothetical protein n=1 Tax=Desulfocapsa sulfexigens TaxID=65555 RepID=UPI00034583BD|nr:hypothetical protein [Desulfocapsa sulfexigens]
MAGKFSRRSNQLLDKIRMMSTVASVVPILKRVFIKQKKTENGRYRQSKAEAVSRFDIRRECHGKDNWN